MNERPERKNFFEEIALELRYKAQYMKRARSDGSTWWKGLDDDGGSWETGDGPDSNYDDDSDSGESTASSPGGDKKTQGGQQDAGAQDDGKSPDTTNTTSPTGDMTYQCDAHPGASPATDCEHLAWSGLKPPTTVETLQPKVPTIYISGTCALGISTTGATAVTITWAHLLAAFETLNNLCVQNPIQGVRGGRAYYGVQGLQSWLNGKKKRKRGSETEMERRDSVGGVAGSEALPIGINATVWRHQEGQALQCEWGNAIRGEVVKGCESG